MRFFGTGFLGGPVREVEEEEEECAREEGIKNGMNDGRKGCKTLLPLTYLWHWSTITSILGDRSASFRLLTNVKGRP